jgi:hypothetical protein
MTHRQDALEEILDIARRNNLSAEEISRAFHDKKLVTAEASNSVLSKILAYIGGILVFSGICVFILMKWDDMNAPARILITLGTGFTALVMGITASKDARYARAATPLFLIAAFLQPFGLITLLAEYGFGGTAKQAIFFVSLFMLIQQGLLFHALQRATLAFFAILFGTFFCATGMSMIDIEPKYIFAVMGLSLIFLSLAAGQSKHDALSPFWMLAGSLLFLCGAYAVLFDTAVEPLYLGIGAFFVYASTVIRSRILLTVGSLSMIAYIGKFTAEHFAHTVGWPIALMISGLALIGISAGALRLNKKYFKA